MTQTILVPATSANLGPGFDSLGIAVALYLKVEIGVATDTWQVIHPFGATVPSDASNLIVKTALEVDPSIEPHQIKVNSEIPLARGLGSSSSAIVAGLILADVLGEHGWSSKELLEMATRIEGHPDNVAPAIYGDLTVSTTVANQVTSIKLPFPDADLVAFIPNYELLTSESRAVLPEALAYRQAVVAGSIGNTLVAALARGDLAQAAPLLEADCYHEPYRSKLVPELAPLRDFAHANDAVVYLSGAGPTLMMVAPTQTGPKLATQAQKLGFNGEFVALKIDRQGARLISETN